MDTRSEINAELDAQAKDYGYKAANLIVLKKAGIDVPPFFPISHQACMAHMNLHAPQWKDLWTKFKVSQEAGKGRLTQEAKELLQELRSLILDAFARFPLTADQGMQDFLAEHSQSGDLLMVRSTGDEDQEGVANPGGNESYSGIKPTIESISSFAGKVIASYCSEKSLEQRIKSASRNSEALVFDDLFAPVLLQKMVKETKTDVVRSGVMYTSQSGIFVQAAPGHNELVVNSKGLVDSYYVTRGGVIHQQIYEKDNRLVMSDTPEQIELVSVENPPELRNQSTLSPHIVERIAEIGKKVEKFYGSPRDIEFVYSPKDDKVYVVQTRPIPRDVQNKVFPRAISPQKIKSVKEVAKKENRLLMSGKTISPCEFKAQEITRPEEILICTTIKEALDIVLHRLTESQVNALKAVIVKTDSPPTSHEAAEFNSLGKAVLYIPGPDAQKVVELVSKNKSDLHLIIDTQRKMLVDWSGKQGEENILADGLFKSSMPTERSLHAKGEEGGRRLYPVVEEMEFKKYISSHAAGVSLSAEASRRKLGPYACLLELLEDIEGVDASSERLASARQALAIILASFEKLAASGNLNSSLFAKSRYKSLYHHVISYAIDISKLLNEIELAQKAGQKMNEINQHELLNMVSGLEALIANPGRSKLFSDSLYQTTHEDKARKEIMKNHANEFNALPNDEVRDIVIQLYKIGNNAANEELKQRWTDFILNTAKNGQPPRAAFGKLCRMAKYCAQNDLTSMMINVVFDRHGSLGFSQAFTKLIDSINQLGETLPKISSFASEWETKISSWGVEQEYDKSIVHFENAIKELIEQFKLVGDLNDLKTFAKAQILREIARATEVIDLSIKALVGSRDFVDDKAKLEKFARILKPYHELMDFVILQVRDGINKKGMTRIEPIKDEISRKFEISLSYAERQINGDVEFGGHVKNELLPSGVFYVDAAVITSRGSLEEALSRPITTLADLYSLFHQNIVAALPLIGSEFKLSTKSLPVYLQTLDRELSGIEGMSLTSSGVRGSIITMEYNLSLQDHALQLIVQYNKDTKFVEIVPKPFGTNRGGRVALAAILINKVIEEIIPQFNNTNAEGRALNIVTDGRAIATDNRGMPLLEQEHYANGSLKRITQDCGTALRAKKIPDGQKNLKMQEMNMAILNARLKMPASEFVTEGYYFMKMLKVICQALGSSRQAEVQPDADTFLARSSEHLSFLMACENNDVKSVEKLIENNINQLHVLPINSALMMAIDLKQPEMVKVLLPHIKYNFISINESPLILAIKLHLPEIASILLLESKFNPATVDGAGKSAYDYARESKNDEIRALFIKHEKSAQASKETAGVLEGQLVPQGENASLAPTNRGNK